MPRKSAIETPVEPDVPQEMPEGDLIQDPQTEPESEALDMDIIIPDSQDSQTELIPDESNPGFNQDSQTDPEMSDFVNAPEAALYPQTEIDSGYNMPQTESEPSLIEPEAEASDGNPEPIEEKPKRKSRKKAEADDNQPQSDSTESKPARASSRRRANAVVSIDETRSVETSADKRNNDHLDLVESLKSKKILSGTIQGVERSEENPALSYAVIYHGDFKIIIPATETVEPPADFRDRSPGDVMHYMVTKRLGAEVDYIVKGVDKAGIAAASRLEAMAAKRKEYYFGTDRDGNNILYEDLIAEARVVSVIRAGIFVDLFGLETYVPMRELSYQRGVDAAAQFQPGQRVLVKILELDRMDRNGIKVIVSVKQATENPYEKALRKYTAGSRYVGTVSMVDTNGVFVALDGGIDCLCSYPKRGRPPRGSRVTVRIIGINNETNRIWGAITHMTTAR